ncbi:MAG: cyclase family protein [Methanospirillaceae archaeon]|nr:cyclase family protein [Methanospirillaceae archaeon]
MIYDITRPLQNGMPYYPGDPEPRFRSIDCGKYRISSLSLSSHTGTHIDAPAHYIQGGTPVDEIAVSVTCGPCRVLDIRGCKRLVTPEDLHGLQKGERRVLFRTGYSSDNPDTDYPGISAETAQFLVQSGISCIGTDTPSIESPDGDGTVHQVLCNAGIPIIENLDLEGIDTGNYILVALPLRLAGGDGAPCRAVLCTEPKTGDKLCIF